MAVTNDGDSDALVTLSVAEPFSVDVTQLQVARSSHSNITVRYAPTAAGHDSTKLFVGTLAVPLSGDARAEADCPPKLCNDVFFDTLSRSCASKPVDDGTACHTGCTAGACQSGTCVGSPISCDDGNGCTVDSCSEPGGCSHSAQSCPAPSDPCKAGACDPVKGCIEQAVPDGTSCGEDLCVSSTSAICLSGSCVRRPRLAGTRCANTWTRPYMDLHQSAAFTWDSSRRHAIQYGGWSFRDARETWEWDFDRGWQQVFPAARPDVSGGTLGYDPNRQRTVLFSNSETWEYDGLTWTQIFPAQSPPPVDLASFVYDSASQKLILYGGFYCTPHCHYPTDFWTWDGTDWANVAAAPAPASKRNPAVGYDEYRSRLVVFGGMDLGGINAKDDLWEFDGAQWTEVVRPDGGLWPPGSSLPSLVFDQARAQLVLVNGEPGNPDGGEVWSWNGTDWTRQTFDQGPQVAAWGSHVALDQQTGDLLAFSTPDLAGGELSDWRWDGGQWATQTAPIPSPRSRASLAYDSLHDKVVMFGGFVASDYVDYQQTWLWNGARWSIAASDHSPPPRTEASMAFDSARGVTVLFGGVDYTAGYYGSDDTWEWDGAAWTQKMPQQSPPERYGASIAYDSTHQRVMLFGGYSESTVQALHDLWAYDGNTWQQISTLHLPPARVGAKMVYDEAHQQLVLAGGSPERMLIENQLYQDTWTFDGTDWTERTVVNAPAPRARFGMAYDSTRQCVWAFGGWTVSNVYGTELNDTLQWDGTTWTTVTPTVSPPPLGGMDMIYDPTRDELLFMGGAGDDEYAPSDGTWVYGPP